jgi:hypothetical protein
VQEDQEEEGEEEVQGEGEQAAAVSGREREDGMKAGRSRVRVFGVAAVCAVGLLGATAGSASATIFLNSAPNFVTDPASVGQTNLPGSIVLSNDSTAGDAGGGAEVIEIRLTPSCGVFTEPPCPSPEPGVITINPNATGALGTACAGQNFTFPVIDNATGEVGTTIPPETFSFTSGDECRINFTYNVAKMPAVDSQPGEEGIQTDQILQVQFFHPGSFDNVVGLGSDFTTIQPAKALPPGPPAATGQRAAALKKCSKIKKKKPKRKCKRKARLLPV